MSIKVNWTALLLIPFYISPLKIKKKREQKFVQSEKQDKLYKIINININLYKIITKKKKRNDYYKRKSKNIDKQLKNFIHYYVLPPPYFATICVTDCATINWISMLCRSKWE